MKEAKPILIVNIPEGVTRENIERLQKDIKDEMANEYHLFIIQDSSRQDITFECFNACNLPEIELESLKQKVSKQCSDL